MSYENVSLKYQSKYFIQLFHQIVKKTGEKNGKRLKTIGNGWKQKMSENGRKHLKIVEMFKTNENG